MACVNSEKGKCILGWKECDSKKCADYFEKDKK